MITPALAVLLCGAVALVSPLAVRPILRRVGAVDRPNARSSHSTPVLRGGGLAVLAGFAVGGAIGSVALDGPLVVVVVFGAIASVIGLVDDIRGLSARVRLAAQLGMGFMLGAVVFATQRAEWWIVPACAVLFASYVNMTNFMDGIDAISSLHGGVVGAALAFVGASQGEGWLVAAGAMISVAFLAFMPWNLLGARMFLGDCGSYLLGGSIAAAACSALAAGVPWPAALGPLAIYATDTGTAVVRRVARGEPWWQAHREHAYQKAVDAGMRHLTVATWVAVFTVASALAGMTSLTVGSWVSAALIAAVCSLYLMLFPVLARTVRRTAT